MRWIAHVDHHVIRDPDMCGITGIVSGDQRLGSTRSLHTMTDAIKHRGPDDSGYYESKTRSGEYLGLGHRRLSIIDVETGKQPISNEDQTIFLVFNGEIYNYLSLREELLGKGHIFRTSSDSEVIVHAYEEYGEQCVTLFRGMFAFAIWDSVKGILLLARDRFGKKPLFYSQQGDTLLFASEIKSLIALHTPQYKVNENVIRDYIVYRYVPGPETLYENIYKLEPGSIALYEDGKLTHSQYYFPPDKRAYRSNERDQNAARGFLNLLREAVRLRMISDVPFGAFLSGGIDSSAVVGLMTEYSSYPVKTFSVGFGEADYSELQYAEVIARHFNTEHHELTVSHDELISFLPELIRFRDAPVSEPSDIPIYLLSKEAGKTVKMVLTGEGSDEILGGYPKHVFERYRKYYQLIPRALRRAIVEPAINALPYRYRRAKTAINTLGIDRDADRQPRWFGAIGYEELEKLLEPGVLPRCTRSTIPFDVEEGNSALRKILYFDQTSWLPDNLLERGDRMTMAASIEARMPFMDHELAEYVSGLPDKYRIHGRVTKWLLREAVKEMIPESILARPKVGFRLPVNEWFRGPMKDYLFDHLLGDRSVSKKYYRQQYLKKVLDDHLNGHQNHEKLLWTLLNLEIWLRQTGVDMEESIYKIA